MEQTTSIPEHARGLVGTCLAVLFIAFLIGASYWILLPFLPALVWATMIVVSTWPFMLRLQDRLTIGRGLTAMIMVLGLFIILVVPLLLSISTIVENTDEITSWFRSAASFERPSPPQWLANIPVLGPKLASKWAVLSSSNKDDLIARVSPYLGRLVTWFVSQIGNFGLLFVHFLLTLVLSAILYLSGETSANGMRRFAKRLAGERGLEAVHLAGKAIRAVALGVVGTALCQSVVAGLGFILVGVPQAILLTALTFFCSVLQIGAVPVMLPVVIWLFWSDMTGWGIVMVVWTVIVCVMDNVLRPWLIRRSATLPLLLIFAGVVGGLIAFGIIGLFVGPVVLAVSYTLINAWIAETEEVA